MNGRRAGRVAWTLWTLELALVVAGGAMALAGGFRPGEAVLLVLLPTFQITAATVGALIGSRHPGNPIGWLFLAMALGWGISGVATGVASLVAGGVIPVTGWARLADWVGSWSFLPGIIIPVTFLFLLFPNGRLLSPGWGWVAGISVAAVVVIVADAALAPGPLEDVVLLRENPYALGDRAVWELVGTVGWIAAILGIVASAVALFLRFRRSSGEERQRIKWLSYAAVAVAVLFLIAAAGFFFTGEGADPLVTTALLPGIILLALLIVPAATGIAMLRHRLFDIDLVVNRAVVYGLLAAFVTAMYLAIVVGVGALVGSRGNLFLSIVATAVIALAFQPVRQRARHLANRLVYGKRATPYEVLSELAQGVGGNYSADDVMPRLASIVGQGTGAARAEVWLRVGTDLRREAVWPADDTVRAVLPVRDGLPSIPGVDRALAVEHQGELLGALAVSMPRGEAVASATDKLLRDVASQAGLVLRNVRLIEELRASRQRLVAVQDEERRRLERNIHDGAQQQLVALSVKMRLLKALARKDPGKAEDLVDQLQEDSKDALDNLRDLARGIYPPLLADQGLAVALESQARKASFPVEVESDGVGRYPQEAEATAYFCVLEALQNAAKYADASRAVVRLGEEDGHLVFTVADDGRGFDVDTTPRGAGLQNMVDRVEAVGGSLEVRSARGQGTTVAGRVPTSIAS